MTTSNVEITIGLEGSQEIFFSGGTVDGVVTIKVNKLLRASVLKAEFQGIYILRNKAGELHRQKIVSEETKLDMNGMISDIPPGTYKSPISFKLESTFPSSLVCLVGAIEYKVVARCGYKLASDGDVMVAEAVQHISVNKYLDLKDKPLLLVEAHLNYDSSLNEWWFLCCGGKLTVSMKIKRRAYVCGERIEVSASISNMTSRTISKSEIVILQRVRTKACINKQRIVGKERGMVMRNSTIVWMNESLTVPAVPPTSDDPHMLVSYVLRMALTRDNGKTINMDMPIFIGNLPVDNNIIEGVGREISFTGLGKFESSTGEGDVPHDFIPSYLVYRFSQELPSTPAPPLESN